MVVLEASVSLDDELDAALARQDEAEIALAKVLAENEELQAAFDAAVQAVKSAGLALAKEVGPLVLRVAASALVDQAVEKLRR